jgi:hypothetical protein
MPIVSTLQPQPSTRSAPRIGQLPGGGSVQRMGDPPGGTGGEASAVQIVPVGRLFVSAMKNADGDLLLISHRHLRTAQR